MFPNSFYLFYQDIEEAEELRIQKEALAAKSSMTGKKSRRERKLLKVITKAINTLK